MCAVKKGHVCFRGITFAAASNVSTAQVNLLSKVHNIIRSVLFFFLATNTLPLQFVNTDNPLPLPKKNPSITT